ncbi:rna-directed dna polymerase from mobile element jockey-like [Willisornis vidua]|uniref:Rna-directed dna polymerase from mobile element jockey-like n=1 Tax=Willisornis vidua TaxID=1566151 RepID=A0ABQ9CYH0_9PASS|nr:rna-directed dna polymerase from mobile element jockey-like [Willisornis vidua]
MVTKNCGQWFNVQVDTSDKWHSSGIGIATGTALTSFVSDMDSGIEHTLSKFVDDSQLCGAVNTVEGVKEVIQRDPDSLDPEVGLCRPREVQQSQVEGPAPESEQSQG